MCAKQCVEKRKPVLFDPSTRFTCRSRSKRLGSERLRLLWGPISEGHDAATHGHRVEVSEHAESCFAPYLTGRSNVAVEAGHREHRAEWACVSGLICRGELGELHQGGSSHRQEPRCDAVATASLVGLDAQQLLQAIRNHLRRSSSLFASSQA